MCQFYQRGNLSGGTTMADEEKPSQTPREAIRRASRISAERDSVRDNPPPPAISERENKAAGAAHSGIDGAVLAVSELLFLLFGLRFGDDLYHAKPITLLHWSYLAVAVICAIGGPMWPTIRNRWASPAVAASIAMAARDARIWIALLLIFFLYGTAPEIYKWASIPAPAIKQTSAPPNEDITKELNASREQGVIVANQLGAALRERDEARSEAKSLKRQWSDAQHAGAVSAMPSAPIETGPITWDADSQFLVVTGGGPTAAIDSVLIQGKSTTSVAIKEAYAVSGLTGHRQDLIANVPYKGPYPVDKCDISTRS